MDLIYRYRAVWSGPAGLPGVTTMFAFNDTTEQVFADGMIAFLKDALSTSTTADFLPSGISILGDPIVDHIDPASGELLDSVPVTPPAQVAGIGAGAYVAAAGACVTWQTGAVHAGHKVRGRTYLVPLATTAYDSTGTLSPGYLTNIRNAASAYIAGAVNGCIWSRNHPGAADGAALQIQTGTVVDKACVLTSRRD